MRSIGVILCSKSLQGIQFDTKHGYLSRLTPNDPYWGQGQDDPHLRIGFRLGVNEIHLSQITFLVSSRPSI